MAWAPSFARDLLGDFSNYCAKHYIGPDRYGADELGLYIGDWLNDDVDTVRIHTGGDYTAWLEAVLIIIDAYDKDPSIIDYGGNEAWKDDPNDESAHPPQERRVTRMLNFAEWGHGLVDMHRFRVLMAGGE